MTINKKPSAKVAKKKSKVTVKKVRDKPANESTKPIKKKTKPKGILKKKRTDEKEKQVDKSKQDDEESTKQSDVKHSALLKSIQSLDGKKAPISQRSEPAKQSEYHSTEGTKVHFGELVKSLDTSDSLKKHLKQQDGSRKLPKPVEKIHLKKAERSVKYGEAKEQLQKWESVVEEGRVAPQQQFPLEKSHITISSAKKEAAMQEPRTAMEMEIQALLKGEEYVPGATDNQVTSVLTKAEERAKRAMDLGEARQELALRRKHRLMVSQAAAKNRRQGKIKSRSYHKHLKQERRNKAFKALEKLKSEDPDLWREKAEELERARIEERATLRHKGKSKFAKLAKRYGKFNEKIKDSLDEMRSKGVELLKKQADESSSEESEEERADVDMSDSDDENVETPVTSSQNPWARSKLPKEKSVAPTGPLLNTEAFDDHSSSESEEDEHSPDEIITDFTLSDQVKVIEPDMSQTLSPPRKKAAEAGVKEAMEAAEELSRDADDLVEGVSNERLKTRADVDRFDERFEGEEQGISADTPAVEEEMQPTEDIDVNKVISIPSTDLSGQNRLDTQDSSGEDDEQGLNIAQAFADDDIAEEFSARRKRKFEEEDEAANAEAALNKLPGWGKWSGAGLENKPKRKLTRWQREKQRKEELRKAAEKAEKEAKRSKFPKGVIINTDAIISQPISKYQVSMMKTKMKAPAFQALMSHPVGREFVPALAHNELCKPHVITERGAIITPMNKNMVKEKKKDTFPSGKEHDGKKIATQYDLEPIRKRPKNPRKLAQQLKT